MTVWDDQVNLFRTAASMSPSGAIDHVVANAGIAVDDEVFSYDGTSLFSPGILVETDIDVNRPGLSFKPSQPEDDRSEHPRSSLQR